MSGLLDNNYLDPEVQAKRIAQQKREAIIRALHSADDARGVPRRNLSEEEIQQYLMTRQPLQDYVESASENPYMNNIPTQQDLWRKEAELSALEGPETANMQPSPYELTLLAENQQRHPSGPPPLSGVSDTDYPRFPASDQAQMGRYITKSDRSDPNFFAPKGFSPGGLLDEVNPIQADRDAYIANATKPKSFLSRNRRSILNEPQSVKPVKRNNLLEDETGWEQNPYFWSTLIDRGLDFGFNE